MKKLTIAFFLFMLMAAVLLPKYKVYDEYGGSVGSETEPRPFVTAASLSDSIPSHILNQLRLEKVQGIRINYQKRPYVDYFTYSCSKEAFLRLTPSIPFAVTRSVSDATYRTIAFDELHEIRKTVSGYELENAPTFWAATADEYEAVEFMKAPYRHIVLFNRSDGSVLHRVEPYS